MLPFTQNGDIEQRFPLDDWLNWPVLQFQDKTFPFSELLTCHNKTKH